MGDLIGAVIAGALIAAVIIVAAWPRREVVPPVPRRAMRQMLEREAPSDPDGTS